MARARQEAAWGVAAAVMNVIARCHGAKTKPDDFNPFRRRRIRGERLNAGSLGSLAKALGAGRVTIPADQIRTV